MIYLRLASTDECKGKLEKYVEIIIRSTNNNSYQTHINNKVVKSTNNNSDDYYQKYMKIKFNQMIYHRKKKKPFELYDIVIIVG